MRGLLRINVGPIEGRENTMKNTNRFLATTAVILICGIAASSALADDLAHNSYDVTRLTSDIAGQAENTDALLQNAWGVAFTPGASPFWVADNATGCSTLYDGQGTAQALKVKIPLPGGIIPSTACTHADPNNPPNPTPAAPTGLVWNPTMTFLVPGTTQAALFIFATEDGTISAWAGGLTPSDQAVLAV